MTGEPFLWAALCSRALPQVRHPKPTVGGAQGGDCPVLQSTGALGALCVHPTRHEEPADLPEPLALQALCFCSFFAFVLLLSGVRLLSWTSPQPHHAALAAPSSWADSTSSLHSNFLIAPRITLTLLQKPPCVSQGAWRDNRVRKGFD